MIIKNNSEFGIELTLAVPYAYWLHEQGQLEKVITSRGMKPFYYFCDNVEEKFEHRTIDNAASGLNDLPNNWIHHNSTAIYGKGYGELIPEEQIFVNGMLDYSQWKMPDYKAKYGDKLPVRDRPTVFITNVYNHPNNSDKRHYHHFPILALYDMFTLLDEKGYDVIYKRENNQTDEITYDQNEQSADIVANVEGYGLITDYDLARKFDNVTLFQDTAIDQPLMTYNERQLILMASCDKFISVCGGNGILSSCFGGDVIIYVTQGKELRPGYFDENSYFRKLSNACIIPIIDPVDRIKENGHDFRGMLEEIDKWEILK